MQQKKLLSFDNEVHIGDNSPRRFPTEDLFFFQYKDLVLPPSVCANPISATTDVPYIKYCRHKGQFKDFCVYADLFPIKHAALML